MPPTARAKRGAYRKPAREKIDALDAKRKAAGITIDEWARRAGLSRRGVRYMMKDGKAFPRAIASLTHALRELIKEKGRAEALFNRGT